MKTVIRVNIQNPNSQKGLVGFAYQLTDISWAVRTIHGIFEVMTEDIKFFKEHQYHLIPTW